MLIDRFDRTIDYLRLSVTDRCDLRCSYCMPEGFKDFEEPEHWLTFDEIERVIAAFTRLGVSRIRLTGGEPLLRAGLPDLARRLCRLPGLKDLSLSTNATQLQKHALALAQAGVKRINVSLDSLDATRLAQIAGRDVLPKILAGLDAAQAVGLQPIKINMVVMRGVNDDEVEAMTEFCMARAWILRLIETMPMGDSGRNVQYQDLQPVKEQLRVRFGLIEGQVTGGGPARYLQTPDGKFSVGFITPMSQHFCASCNRVRLTVDGTLYLCLGQDDKVELRPLLRAGISDQELEATILRAIAIKPERHEFREQPAKVLRFMSATGG